MNLELQIDIVKSVARSIKGDWDKVTLNIEIGDVCGSETLSPMCYKWLGDTKEQVFPTLETKTYFRQLRHEMGATPKQTKPGMLSKLFGFGNKDNKNCMWSVCDLVITSDGKYNFNFSYEEPKRITDLNSK